MASDDDYYSYSDEDLNDDNIDEDDLHEGNEEDDLAQDYAQNDHKEEKSYTILSAGDIKKRQDQDINQVSAVLSVSTDEACILLGHYKWDALAAQEAWFTDESNVRITLGLPAVKVADPPKSIKITCGVCFDDFDGSNNVTSAACGHWYCVECWKGYIKSAIDDGAACLSLCCPEPSCIAAVTRTMVYNLLEEEDRDRYTNYFLRSYVENNRLMKWCPSADCEFSVEFEVGSDQCDVLCKCLHSFCWKCVEDSHRPVDCEMVANWIMKNTSEAENTKWILSYSKPCPQCKRPIEKNLGCMHMTCRDPCRYQFCWMCLGPWNKHGGSSFYECNKYKEENNKDAVVRNRARESLQRYSHYYERWDSNNRSKMSALQHLRNLGQKLEVLKEKLNSDTERVEFISEAWMQIAACRRILKWTYTYGYYNMGENRSKKEYFECVQGLAELALEKLHGYAEGEGEKYFTPDAKLEEFEKYKLKLKDCTRVVRNHFDNLVRALETGLEDVGTTANWLHEIGTSSLTEPVQYWQCRCCTFVNEMPATICNACLACEQCTYINSSSNGDCQMCGDQLTEDNM